MLALASTSFVGFAPLSAPASRSGAVRARPAVAGLLDGVKDAFGGGGDKPLVAADRVTPFDRWLGLDKDLEAELNDGVDQDVTYVDPSDASNYVSLSLVKPMGIAFVENEGGCGGVFVDEARGAAPTLPPPHTPLPPPLAAAALSAVFSHPARLAHRPCCRLCHRLCRRRRRLCRLRRRRLLDAQWPTVAIPPPRCLTLAPPPLRVRCLRAAISWCAPPPPPPLLPASPAPPPRPRRLCIRLLLSPFSACSSTTSSSSLCLRVLSHRLHLPPCRPSPLPSPPPSTAALPSTLTSTHLSPLPAARRSPSAARSCSDGSSTRR